VCAKCISCARAHARAFVSTHVCMRLYIHINIYVYIDIYIDIYIHAYIHACVSDTCIDVHHTHIYTHIHTCAYIFIQLRTTQYHRESHEGGLSTNLCKCLYVYIFLCVGKIDVGGKKGGGHNTAFRACVPCWVREVWTRERQRDSGRG